MGYNKKVLSKAVSELGKAKAPAKPKDIITDPAGQWKFPGQKTRIPGNDITMQGVNYPVWGQPNVGKGSMMQPGQNYLFPGADYVDETPMAKKGGTLNSKKYSKSMSATNKLFAKNKLFQNKKSKIFDPNSKFKSGGSKLGPINLDPNPLSHYELNYGYNLPTEQDGGVRGNPWLYTYNQESEDRAPGQVIGLGADFQHKSGLHGSTNVELPFFNKNAIGNLYSELGYNKRFKNFDADATLKNYTEPGSKFNPSFTTGIGYNKNLGDHVGFGVGVNNTMVPGNLWNPTGNVSLKYNFQDGGENEDEYMDLTDEEIQAYRDAGYEVDEAPEYETGGFVQHELVKAQKGRTIIHTNKAAYDRANAAESDSLSLYNSANREYNNAMKNIDYFKMFGPTPPSDLIIDKNGNVQEKREFKDPAIIASNVYNKNKKNPIRPVSFYLTGNSGAGSVLEAVKYKKPVIHNVYEEPISTLPLKPIERFVSPEQTIIPARPYVKPKQYSGPRFGTLAGDENLDLPDGATQQEIEAARRQRDADEFIRKTLEYQAKQRGNKPIVKAQTGLTKKPLLISDPDEFVYRQQMYNDSLNMYDYGNDMAKFYPNALGPRAVWKGTDIRVGDKAKIKTTVVPFKSLNKKQQQIQLAILKDRHEFTDSYNQADGRSYRIDPIAYSKSIIGMPKKRIDHLFGPPTYEGWKQEESVTGLYKKPVQPVKFLERPVPQGANSPTRRAAPKPIQRKKPVQFVKEDIQPKNSQIDTLPFLPTKPIQSLNPEFIPQRTIQPKSYSNPNRHGVWSDKQLPRILSPENWLNKTREYQEQQRGVKQPVSQIRKEGGVLDSYQKKGEVKTFKRDIRDQDALSNTGWGTAPVQKKKVQPTVKQKQAQKSFDKNFKVTDKSKYEKTEDKIVKAQQDLKDWGKENGVAVTDSDLKSVADQQWSFAGVGPQKQPDMMQATPEQSNSSRAWEYMTNPFTALKYEISGGGYENMPHHINEMRMAGINPDKNNLVGNMLNALNPLDDIKTIYEGVNDITKGDNSGYTTAGLGLLGFIPGGDYFKGLRKTGKTAETIKDVSKVDDELLKAYNLAVDLKNRGKISNIPNTPQDFDKWLQAQYNKRPLYRTVDVNPETMANPIIREGIRKQGLDPDNPHHVAEYMGTTVAPATVVNRGRRSGGHDELLQGSNKDIMYYAEDPEWIGPRYGGKNPYYVKVHADELPEGLENQVLGLRSESRVRKNYNRNYPQFDINKVPSGALFEDKYLSVGPNTITPILGDKGAKIRKSVSVLSGADFDKLSNKRFDQGGSTEEWEDELDDNQIERLRRAGYTVDELDEVEDVDTYQAGGPTVSQLWKEHTGTDWSEAHRQGLTSGSYADNMKLRDRILNSEFDNMTPGNNIQQNRVKSQNHRDAYVKNVQNLINNNKSLDDLVSMRMGTREGLLNLFPNLGSAKAPVNKPVANTVLPVNNKPVSKPAVKVDRRMAATSSPNSKLPQLKVFDKQVKTVKPKVKEVRSVNINKSATSSPESFNLDKYRTLTDIQQRFADAKKYNVANKIKQKEKVLKKEDKSVQWQMPQLGINAPTPKAKYPTNINNAASNFNTKNKNQKVLPGKKLKEVDRGIMATYINPIVKEVSAPINSALNTLYDVGESIGEKTESTLGKVGELYESYKKEGLINALTQAKNSQKDPEVYKTVIKPKAKIVKPIPQAKEEAYDNDRLAENYQNITDAGNYTINTFSKKLSGVPLGVRNREDERDIKGKAIAYTYAPFKTYNEHLGNSYGGISLKPNSVETDNQPVIVYDNDKMYIDTFKNQKNTGKLISPTYKTDSVTDLVIDKSNRYSSNIEQKMIKLKTARGDKDIPVGTADSSEGSFKDWSGGHLMIENPKTKEVVVIHGKSYELQKMFRKFLQENKLKSANIIETDHKAYSLIKNPKNNILTGEFNRARDNANTKSSGSGNFIYSKI